MGPGVLIKSEKRCATTLKNTYITFVCVQNARWFGWVFERRSARWFCAWQGPLGQRQLCKQRPTKERVFGECGLFEVGPTALQRLTTTPDQIYAGAQPRACAPVLSRVWTVSVSCLSGPNLCQTAYYSRGVVWWLAPLQNKTLLRCPNSSFSFEKRPSNQPPSSNPMSFSPN